MRVVTLGQLRGANQLPTAAKAALWVGAVGIVTYGFIYMMGRSLAR